PDHRLHIFAEQSPRRKLSTMDHTLRPFSSTKTMPFVFGSKPGGKLVFESYRAPSKIAPRRFAPLRSAPSRLVEPLSLSRPKFTSFRFAPVKSASLKSPRRSAPVRSAPRKDAWNAPAQ